MNTPNEKNNRSARLTGFIDGYKASNLASVDEQLTLISSDLILKVQALIDKERSVQDNDLLKYLQNAISVLQIGSSTGSKLKEFSQYFLEYVQAKNVKNKNIGQTLIHDPEVVSIIDRVISLAQQSEDADTLSNALKLGKIVM